jgi:hypothetical protein
MLSNGWVNELDVLVIQCLDNWRGNLGNAREEEAGNVTFVREGDAWSAAIPVIRTKSLLASVY